MTMAKVGDKIRVIDAAPYGDFFYKNGDTFYVVDVWDTEAGVSVKGGIKLYNNEFQVIKNGGEIDDKKRI